MLIRCLLVTVLVFQACLAVPYRLKPRITDGEDAEPGEFPYQVSIRLSLFPPLLPYNHACGGSIIDEYHILTAGHCVLPIGKLKVFAGKHHLVNDEDTQQESDVETTYVHEKYPGGVAPYDIAILKLKTPLVLNERVSAVKLPEQDEVRTGNVVLTGWGSTSKSILPVLPKVLQKATIPILDNKSCQEKFPEGPKTPQIYDSQICTEPVGEISACSGDSGGPLVQFDNDTPTQLGIVSWGVYPCGVNRMPSVYTRVASYVDWIKQTTGANNMDILDEKSIKCSQFVALTVNSKMSPKAIVLFAFLVAVVAGKPHVGIQMPSFLSFTRPHLPLIVGGEPAPEGAYPFIVSLQAYGSHFCAGSIYNEEMIMTAAHCCQAIPSLDVINVKAGKHNLQDSEASEQSAGISQYIVHENYQGGVGPYDICMIKLSSPLKYTDRVQPIELAPAESEPTGEAWLCGWGSISTGPFPVLPDTLQQVKMEYVDRQTCHDAVERLTGSSPVHETNVCTGPMDEGISACNGDSGGPLISRNGQKAIQTGIVSWGIVPCGSEGAPSVFTKVSKFNEWIEQKALVYGNH
ncbi:transmembrane protease serine 9 [Solenopsis invicta]|uniref:transmembrane protease serine 9 n=1 Tax=Solenopsis invicta TaxID=13686 RepID=UPI00193D5B06|nr:transmembrane protease serine 9 [Solenopsis invicta]